MASSLALALLLVVTQPSGNVSEDIYQTIDETGVRLGAYYGCYETEKDGLVCILPEKEEVEEKD